MHACVGVDGWLREELGESRELWGCSTFCRSQRGWDGRGGIENQSSGGNRGLSPRQDSACTGTVGARTLPPLGSQAQPSRGRCGHFLCPPPRPGDVRRLVAYHSAQRMRTGAEPTSVCRYLARGKPCPARPAAPCCSRRLWPSTAARLRPSRRGETVILLHPTLLLL